MAKIKREDLIRMYWGPDCLPSQWMEPFQIAEDLNEGVEEAGGHEVTEEEVEFSLAEYGVERRDVLDFAHKEVWDLLTCEISEDSWNLDCGKQFLYRTPVNGTLVDFFFPEQNITITIDKLIDPSEANAMHISVLSMFRFSPIHRMGAREVVKKILIRGKIRKCYDYKKDTENEW